MEDYILRQIDMIGKVIEAIMLKIGLLKKSNSSEPIADIAKVELLEKLNISIDVLIRNENFINTLIDKYGFSNENLEKLAELLFEFLAPTKNKSTNEYIDAIVSIYLYLDKNGNCFSLKRYYILKELEQYL